MPLTIVHDGRGDVLAGDAQGPGSANVQVKLGLASILTSVFLQKKERICSSYDKLPSIDTYEHVFARLLKNLRENFPREWVPQI